jgi:hypothetical protein
VVVRVTDSQDGYVAVDETVANGGTHADGKKRIFGRWTFQYRPAREFVEQRLHGRVLNACAGKVNLDHDDVVRNDLHPDRDADTHYDVAEIADHFAPESFDCVVFDPPYDDFQADDKYDSLRADGVNGAWDSFSEVVRPQGTVITFGWNSWGMSSFPSFEREETVLFQRGACLRDVIATVDRRTLGSVRWSE